MTEKVELVFNQIISDLKAGKDANEVIERAVSLVEKNGWLEEFTEESITDIAIDAYNEYLPMSDTLDPDDLSMDDFDLEDFIDFDVILANTPWFFDKTDYPSLSHFNDKLKEIQSQLEEIDNLDEVIMDYPEVEVQFNYWVDKGESPTALENEIETQELFVFNEGVIYQSVLVLQADNGKNFTGLELLYKTHQHMLWRNLGDSLIFEGFEMIEEQPNRLILGNVN